MVQSRAAGPGAVSVLLARLALHPLPGKSAAIRYGLGAARAVRDPAQLTRFVGGQAPVLGRCRMTGAGTDRGAVYFTRDPATRAPPRPLTGGTSCGHSTS